MVFFIFPLLTDLIARHRRHRPSPTVVGSLSSGVTWRSLPSATAAEPASGERSALSGESARRCEERGLLVQVEENALVGIHVRTSEVSQTSFHTCLDKCKHVFLHAFIHGFHVFGMVRLDVCSTNGEDLSTEKSTSGDQDIHYF